MNVVLPPAPPTVDKRAASVLLQLLTQHVEHNEHRVEPMKAA